jgi:hypothetical protein
MEVVGCSVVVGPELACFVVGVNLVLVVWGVVVEPVGARGIAEVGIVVVDPAGEVGRAVGGIAVMAWVLVLEGIAVEVRRLMVEIEVVAVGVVPLQSCYLAKSLAQMRIAPWKVVQMMVVYGYTCLVRVGVDLGMTWVHLMGNLVPPGNFALARHSQLVGIGSVGLPE